MSFSWAPVRRRGWGTEPIPERTVERAKLPDVFIGSTAYIEINEKFGLNIRDGLTPQELRVLAGAIRKMIGKKHECNCAYCGWTPPDLGRTTVEEWERRAALFDAIASKDWGMEGGY